MGFKTAAGTFWCSVAITLAGWYLLLPPSKFPRTDAYKKPLGAWEIVRGFDTADDCEDFKESFFESSRQSDSLGTLDPAYRDYMFSQCVATDDPRLKNK